MRIYRRVFTCVSRWRTQLNLSSRTKLQATNFHKRFEDEIRWKSIYHSIERNVSTSSVKMEVSNAQKIVDLRSDTITKPTAEMRQAMSSAEVGDDVFGEDPTVIELQRIAAEMFGKENALFVPSGTMGNLISAMSHCWERGSQIYVGDNSHMYIWEQGGISQIGNIAVKALPMKADGTFDVNEMVRLHKTGENYHNAIPRMVVVENPIDGKVLPLSFMKEVHVAARELGMKIHLDGARIANAMVYLKCKPTDITKWADTVSICLSKGLGAPVGSVIVGDNEFITRARRIRKVLGGGMRQCGILAAAGIISLTKMIDRMQDDHDNAKLFAEALRDYGSDIIEFNMDDVQTNMVWFNLKDNVKCTEEDVVNMFKETCNGDDTSVKFLTLSKRSLRGVFYNGVSSDDLRSVLKKVKVVCEKIRKDHV